MMWSWGLALAGIAGLVLAGNKKKSGWALGIVTQFLWMAYALATAQYGFILGSLAYTWVYARNYLKWRKVEKIETQS